MVDVIQLGPFQVKTSVLIYLLSGLVGYLVIRLRGKDNKDQIQAITEIVSGMALLAFVLWKFSYVLFHPLKAVENPLSILYFSGGSRGMVLAGVGAALYVWIQLRKLQIPPNKVIYLTSIGLLAAWGTFHAQHLGLYEENDLYHLLQSVLAGVFYLWIHNRIPHNTRRNGWIQLVLWFIIGQIFVLFFKDSAAYMLGLSKKQLLYLLLGISCLLADLILKKMKYFKET